MNGRRAIHVVTALVILLGVLAYEASADMQTEVGDDAMTDSGIVTVTRELYMKSTRENAAIFLSQSYVGNGLRRREVVFEEASGDYFDTFRERYSEDNGNTWSEWTPLPDRKYSQGEAVIEVMDLAFGYDPVSKRTIHTVLQRIFPKGHYPGGYYDHTLYRLSEDDGRTWTDFRLLRYEDGPDFDPDNWVNPEYLRTNQVYGGYNIEALTNGTIVTAGFMAVPHVNEAGEQETVTGVRAFVGRWSADAQDYEWTGSEPVTVSLSVSSRGLFEPCVAELRDGDVLLEMRGSSTASTPGRKWISVSHDGGLTWSDVSDLRYDDGEQFYAPSSFARILRSSRTGKLYWIGNISPVPPSGNMPRYPFQIAEIDEERVALKRDTVTVIDDFDPATAPEGDIADLQLTNFGALENRETGEFEVYMTRYFRPNDKNLWMGDVYRYVLRLKE